MIQGKSLFEIWRGWLSDLKGTYEPVRDLEPRKPHTDGRRNPDTKPRTYELDYEEKYDINPKTGEIRRK